MANEGIQTDSGGSASGSGMGGILGAGAGALVTGIGNRRALKHSNRNFNTAMAFNEYMANTQYQRAVADLRAAGLNPLLAYTKGGNSAASVSAPTPPNEAEGVAAAFNSGLTAFAQRRVASAQAANIEASTRKTNAEATIAENQALHSAGNAQQQAKILASQADKLGYEAKSAMIDSVLKRGDITLKDLEIGKQKQLSDLVVQFQQLTNRAAELGIPEKAATAEFYKSVPEAKWLQIVSEVLGVPFGAVTKILGGRRSGTRTTSETRRYDKSGHEIGRTEHDSYRE